MTDVIAAEFLKIRTVRSTYGLLASVAALIVVGVVVDIAMTADWNGAAAEERAHFATADARVVVIPYAQFCLAALGALAVTAEFGTGMIRPSLVAVPDRLAMVAGKAAVVAALSLVVGQLVAFGTFLLSWWIAGAHPAPLWLWPSVSDAIPSVLASGLSVTVCALVGLGIGLLIRSTAGALVTLAALLWVLPSVAFLLPVPWDLRIAAVMLPNLAPQLDPTFEFVVLPPWAVLLTMALYIVAALAWGTLAFTRRDA
ncbi:MAG TPA: ABC transporter permease [Actinophytocola sp.]|uniref:ABC transporter permease n=1 Tax=Actinophytocola sp. TaxID=1872138 RepID=UPI002DBC9A4E|nr:ABC transporter permease [Actinophytocola sp.]HEU5472883.1 ABC transporter permease [Actinophytocola sp.]